MSHLTDCLLVCPPRETTQFYHEYPLLGVGYLAAALNKEGIHTQIYDPLNENISPHDMAQIIASRKPGIIGLSVIYNSLPFFYALVQELFVIYPEGLIVAGGPQITSNPEIIKEMGLKYGFRGEAEKVFPAFCKAVLNKLEPDRNSDGLVINTSDSFVFNSPALIDNPDTVAFPQPESYNLSLYKNILFSQEHAFTMVTSRGCPFDCMFCNKLFKTKYRHNSTAYVINNIKAFMAHGIRYFDFVDETFTLKRERVVDLCNAIINEKLGITWGCWTRADLLDDELLALMKKAGLLRLLIGVEAGNEAMRFAIRKKITNQQYLNVINTCNNMAIKTECTFIMGHPDETLDNMEETISFALTLNPTFAYFYKLNVVPATEIFELYKKEQGKDDHLFEKYMVKQENYPFYNPCNVSSDVINTMIDKAYILFYKRPEKRMLVAQNTFLKHRLEID